MKKTMKITGIFLGTLVFSFSVWQLSQGQSIESVQDVMSDFKGNFLAASDADMIAGAYANGKLNKVAGIEDQLTYISSSKGKTSVNSSLQVSNSVISWPAILEWSPKHKFAYMAETRSIHNKDTQEMKNVFTDFPIGRSVSIIDYKNPDVPKIIQQNNVGENIQGVSINSDETLLASGSTEKGKELIVMRLVEGLIQDTFYFTHKSVDANDSGNGGIRTIEFHPTENIMAVNLNNTHLLFFEVFNEVDGINIKQIGEPIEVAKRWSVGNWHPNGNYFILSDLRWGDGLGAITHGKGKLVSVRFRESGKHQIISKVKVGLSPEGFDISPDGNYAVTINMRRTWAPKKGFWFVPARKTSSLSLVKIDGATGQLTKLGKDYGFKGALPEDAIFDLEGNSIAVAVYHDRNEEFPEEGWIDYWELKNDKLIYTGNQLKVTRGVHNLLLVK